MNVHNWLSLRYFFFFMSWGIYLPYWTGWLVDEKGMLVTQAAIIMSVGLAGRGLSTMFLFPFLSRKVSNRTLLQWMSFGTLLAVVLYIPAQSFTALLAITFLFHVFYPSLMPGLESASSFLVLNKQLKEYGKSRSWGSVGFVVCGMFISVFISWLGDVVILWAFLLIMLVFVALMLRQSPTVLHEKPKSNEKISMWSIFSIRFVPLVLVITFLLQGQHATYYSYSYLYLQFVGAPIFWIGLIINIAVIAEIIFFANAHKLFARTSVPMIFLYAGIGSFLRWGMIYCWPNMWVFIVSQVFHACSFAMAHYGFITFINKYIPIRQIPIVQGMYSAIALSFSTSILVLFGGKLYEIDPPLAFAGMLLCTIPAIALCIVFERQIRRTAS